MIKNVIFFVCNFLYVWLSKDLMMGMFVYCLKDEIVKVIF